MLRLDVVDAVRDPAESAGLIRGVRHRRGPAADPSVTIGRPKGGFQILMWLLDP
jgi:hypothetical protein